MQSVAQIRELFLSFFSQKGYKTLPAESLIPKNDPELLFINSGMAPFKEYFLGLSEPHYRKWSTCQKCMRAGGKHNDLSQVGYTNHHHTLFEMLGNFEINSPHPEMIVELAWSFVTKELKLSPSKLSVSVLQGDDDTAKVWKKFVSSDRIQHLDSSSNFWQMGDTGPCGPCTEIFYVHEDKKSRAIQPIEIWNLVFMKYRKDGHSDMTPLPYVSIDTGMGLERISAVVQGVFDNYRTDIFQTLEKIVYDYTDVGAKLDDTSWNVSAHVVLDHMRAAVFLISEGLAPINLGRGYVLRRVLRRGLFHLHNLVSSHRQMSCITALVHTICDQFSGVYPELRDMASHVCRIIQQEKERFEHTMHHGYQLLQKHLEDCADEVDGEFIFKLYDTYGFPVEASQDVVRKRQKTIDMPAFERSMDRQISMARQARKQHSMVALPNDVTDFLAPLAEHMNFVGFTQCRLDGGKIMALIQDNKLRDKLHPSENIAYMIVDNTPFYAEAGGQVGDTGMIFGQNGQFVVTDTVRLPGLPLSLIVHVGHVIEGHVSVEDSVSLQVDEKRRHQIARNHTCTHILSQVLHDLFSAEQMGSRVSDDGFRFDFSSEVKMGIQEQVILENLVNGVIWEGCKVDAQNVSLRDAMNQGARILRNEQYPDPVRVITIGAHSANSERSYFSKEACCGTHLSSVSDIGLFTIHSMDTIAAGIRRIEASTKEMALLNLQNVRAHTLDSARLLNSSMEDLSSNVNKLVSKSKADQKILQELDTNIILSNCDFTQDLVNSWKLQIRFVEIHSAISLPALIKKLQNTVSGIQIIFAHQNNGYSVLVSVHKQISDKLPAIKIFEWLKTNLSVQGHGSEVLAQGGVKNLFWTKKETIDKCVNFILQDYRKN